MMRVRGGAFYYPRTTLKVVNKIFRCNSRLTIPFVSGLPW